MAHFAMSQIDRWVFCLIESYFASSGPQLAGYWGWHQPRRKSWCPSARSCGGRGCPGELQKNAIEKRGYGIQKQGVGEGDQGLQQPREIRVNGSMQGLGRCWETAEASSIVLSPMHGPGACACGESCTPAGSTPLQVGRHRFSSPLAFL